MRYLWVTFLLVAVLGCSGTAQRARMARDLSLEVAPGTAVLQTGGTFLLTVNLRNNGSRPINICLKNEDGAAVTDANGKRWPLKIPSRVFDAECSETFQLPAGQARTFNDELTIWPAMAAGPGLLDVWLSYSVRLGQFYRPGAVQKLVSNHPVSIQRESSSRP